MATRGLSIYGLYVEMQSKQTKNLAREERSSSHTKVRGGRKTLRVVPFYEE